MKTVLLIAFLNLSNGTRTTIEIPMKDFATCLKAHKKMSKQLVPEGYKVTAFQCLVGAE